MDGVLMRMFVTWLHLMLTSHQYHLIPSIFSTKLNPTNHPEFDLCDYHKQNVSDASLRMC